MSAWANARGKTMISIDEMNEILNELAEDIPPDLFKGLNGGIILLPETQLDEQSIDNDLYVLGSYICSHELGCYIAIYYGSFVQLFSDLSRDELRAELWETLKHELRHHVESLAGERDLEIEDDIEMAQYLMSKAGTNQRKNRSGKIRLRRF